MDRILSTVRPSSLSPMLSFKTSMCSSHLGKSNYKERHGNRVDIAVLRIFVAGCFVKTGAWKKGDFKLTTKMKPATLLSVNCEVIDALGGQTTLSSTLDKVHSLMKPNLFLHCLKAGWMGQDLMCLKMSQRFLNNCLGLKM
ncbi:hypothetical protein SO802_005533 [Lithocarpus litseifolius]|uniref:Uncharacterized protein n=1 Tax=Lithocarpus litseifolius TaxID=425828 RepID=A0AAW2DIF0_9ROSI